jgi:hypothetical protein
MLTITLTDQEQQALRLVCDAALRNQGLQMMQPCGVLLAKLQQQRPEPKLREVNNG